jgi:hypothetical protein
MNNSEYHAHPAIGASDIKAFLRSPYHYWCAKHGPARVKKPPTPSMQLGTALHATVLEPDRFDAEYGIGLNLPKRSNADKALHQEHEARYKFILTPSEYEQVLSMATSLQTHPVAGEILRTLSETETSHFLTCPRTGLEIKCRPDGLRVRNHSIIDLKTTVDASDRKLRYTFSDFGYDVQAVHYLHCLPGYCSFVFLMVENTPPYAVRVVYLGDAWLGAARLKHFKALDSIGHLTETLGLATPWPAYESKMLTL